MEPMRARCLAFNAGEGLPQIAFDGGVEPNIRALQDAQHYRGDQLYLYFNVAGLAEITLQIYGVIPRPPLLRRVQQKKRC